MPPGLRERKKLKTRAAIQREAMRLFLEKGYQATTIDEIAEAVEISPSTFFNYFPSKEDVILQDELDPPLIAAFNALPPEQPPITALRNAMRTVFSHLTSEQSELARQRMALIASDPDLRSAMMGQFMGLVDQVADVLATRVGGSHTDFELRNMSGAILGVLMTAIMAAMAEPPADMMEMADRALAHLEAGLPLPAVS